MDSQLHDQSYLHDLDHSTGEGYREPSDLDWEKPPIHQLRTSGKNTASTIIAQGEVSQHCCHAEEKTRMLKLLFAI
jgi:hypothetical protein